VKGFKDFKKTPLEEAFRGDWSSSFEMREENEKSSYESSSEGIEL
jgi:hypothetical protein